MRIKTLHKRAEKWMHEFPLVYGFGIHAGPAIAIYHDAKLTEEDKQAIIAKYEAECPNHGHEIIWLVTGPFVLDSVKCSQTLTQMPKSMSIVTG